MNSVSLPIYVFLFRVYDNSRRTTQFPPALNMYRADAGDVKLNLEASKADEIELLTDEALKGEVWRDAIHGRERLTTG